MTTSLNEEEALLVETVRAFIDREVKPTVREVEHADEYPEAPLMIVGEGTNEIQRNVIAGQLVARGGL
jgi:alkylation response protein AidB-like acyl-CoA dehydrogenase